MTKKIYLIDDEPDVLKVMTFRLKKAGYEVESFLSGQLGLDQMRQEPPDLVVLDLQMPHPNGYEIAAAMEQSDNLKKVPIVYLTGKIDFDRRRIPQSDEITLFYKPCNFEEFLATIDALTKDL